MTTVTYEITKDGFRIECEGHSNYAETGKDIVCAGISTLIQTLIVHTDCFAHILDGYAYLEGDSPEYAEFVLTGLQLIEGEYGENLKVVEGCPRNSIFNLK